MNRLSYTIHYVCNRGINSSINHDLCVILRYQNVAVT